MRLSRSTLIGTGILASTATAGLAALAYEAGRGRPDAGLLSALRGAPAVSPPPASEIGALIADLGRRIAAHEEALVSLVGLRAGSVPVAEAAGYPLTAIADPYIRRCVLERQRRLARAGGRYEVVSDISPSTGTPGLPSASAATFDCSLPAQSRPTCAGGAM